MMPIKIKKSKRKKNKSARGHSSTKRKARDFLPNISYRRLNKDCL